MSEESTKLVLAKTDYLMRLAFGMLPASELANMREINTQLMRDGLPQHRIRAHLPEPHAADSEGKSWIVFTWADSEIYRADWALLDDSVSWDAFLANAEIVSDRVTMPDHIPPEWIDGGSSGND
ncbi:hypothetical protein [Streptomyces smyrnaeus]|uniref:hypothetical protein n=1 Tax=Streptomyces smyrnaeus TaxID=1387713 RepID=UPI0033F3B18B